VFFARQEVVPLQPYRLNRPALFFVTPPDTPDDHLIDLVVRAIEGGPISMPIRWEELDDESIGPQSFTLRNAIDKLKQEGDAWKKMYDRRDRLGEAMERLKEIGA